MSTTYAIDIKRVVSLLPNFKLEGAHRTEGEATSWIQRPINFSASDAGHAQFIEVQGIWFMVWDNGGEIGLDRLNDGELAKMIPARFCQGVNPNDATLAMWLACAITGTPIDYESSMSDEEEEILLGCAR